MSQIVLATSRLQAQFTFPRASLGTLNIITEVRHLDRLRGLPRDSVVAVLPGAAALEEACRREFPDRFTYRRVEMTPPEGVPSGMTDQTSPITPVVQTPSQGRVVRYVMADGTTRAAEVTNHFNGLLVNLTVKLDYSNDLQPSGVPGISGGVRTSIIPPGAFSPLPGVLAAGSAHHMPEEAKVPGTWHWGAKI